MDKIKPFEYWVQKTLPAVYDDSLSYYQLLAKIVHHLNTIGDTQNVVIDKVKELMNWFDNLDVQDEINSKLDKMAEDGTLDQIINHNIFNDLNQEIANLDSKIEEDISNLNTELNTRLTNLNTELNTRITNFETYVDDKLSKKGYKYYGTPEEYGAVGDGVVDDTKALQECLNNHPVTVLTEGAVYRITETIMLPNGHSINGNSATIQVKGEWKQVSKGVSVPVNTMLWVQHRQAEVPGSVLIGKGRYIKDIRLHGDTAFELTGMYLGNNDKDLSEHPTTVNDSVAYYTFDNIAIHYCYDGLHLGEVWECRFNNIQTSYIRNRALAIIGQCVNNNFIGCSFSTGGTGWWSVFIDGASYRGTIRRPEGITFNGGFIGYGVIGIEIVRALAFSFNNITIDLNERYGILMTDASFVTFTDCWIQSETLSTVNLIEISTINNATRVSFKGCRFETLSENHPSIYVDKRQNGVIIEGCFISNPVIFKDSTGGMLINNIFDGSYSDSPKIEVGHLAGVVTENNKYKIDMTDVVVTRLQNA